MEKIERLRELDNYLHSIPELGLQEYETANFIRKTLENKKILYEKIANTGTLVYFEGEEKSIIAFRADIDALPLGDNSNHGSPSKKEGYSHACGHSGHTSALLETILEVKELINSGIKLKKSLLFIFQPGEEGFAGAKVVISDKNFKKYSNDIVGFYATHLRPELKEGVIGVNTGFMTAQNINIKWDIEGKGGHGAYPHKGIDIVVITSELIGAYQTIRSRNIHPGDMYLFTIGKFFTGSKINGKFKPGGARNIIPNNIQLEGTIRMYDKKYIEVSRERIEKINKGFEEAYDIKINMYFEPKYPPMLNDEKLSKNIKKAAQNLKIQVIEENKSTGSEDFSFFGDIAPIFMFATGIRNEKKGHIFGLHNPKFGYDVNALQSIVKIYLKVIENCCI
ncbi:MAG: M20 family metallopeptidase [Fusobacterium sp. JB021]|nr:M20 family metallopeptidase [Fusobacterium sp. JB021]MDP0507074.1 M20 family metallopeptidase [Fusobacterium sp. JB019]